MKRIVRVGAQLLTCLGTVSCLDSRASAVHVERTDSAGVGIVTNRGEDVLLPWTFEPVLTLGAEEDGPLAFFGIGEFVRTDAQGNIYVLDAGNRRVLVFDAHGRHLRSMGSRGSGPGEFEYAGGFFVLADGTVAVFDTIRQRLVVWGPLGDVVSFPPIDSDGFVNPLHLAGSRIFAAVSVIPSESGGNRLELHLIDGDERRVLAVESVGFAEWVPSIRRLRAAPDGTLWVNRSPHRADRTRIDVFSPTGEYVGTLPPETLFPAAFTPSGEIVTVEKDELDLERMVVYRVVRD